MQSVIKLRDVQQERLNKPLSWSILGYIRQYLAVSRNIWQNRAISGYLGLFWCILDYHVLALAISDYHLLSLSIAIK